MAHLGVTSTYHIMRMRFWFPYMKKRINAVIKCCKQCQVQGKNSGSITQLHPLSVPSRAFSRWGIDFIGPYPKSRSGNKWILLAIEYSTNWVVAKALSEANTTNVANFIYNEILINFGAPDEIVSDRGVQFTAKVMEEYMQIQKIKHLFTSEYHPQTNGKTERVNGVIGNIIAKMAYRDKTKWDQYLGMAVWATRIRPHSVTKISPFFLVYGQEPRIPGDELPPTKLLAKLEEFTSTIERVNKLELTRMKGREEQNKAKGEMIKRHNEINGIQELYEEGSYVLMINKKKKKLDPKYLGHFKIIKQTGLSTYKLETPTGIVLKTLVRHNRLVPAYSSNDKFTELWTKVGARK
ncbi:Retrovirus-related Pol polyprotein from transposon [Smittium culicis]|uniref:Retrovirus-related Pol polyprotein from transposon n=1 Tax=Smittium culicis TaxID=133412 RepID=A0A1R1XIQ7_9FUNG|nr:Retrovirus-related Pol polyprotein from transposon [Smittium culicis]